MDNRPYDPRKYTDHFYRSELSRSTTANAHGIDNTIPKELDDTVYHLCVHMEDVRKLLGNKEIVVSSGYRCLALNRALGSRDTSDHIKGQAMDFTCPEFGTPFEICLKIAASDLPFKQLIYEKTWVHLSWDIEGLKKGNPPLRQKLTLVGSGYMTGILDKKD